MSNHKVSLSKYIINSLYSNPMSKITPTRKVKMLPQKEITTLTEPDAQGYGYHPVQVEKHFFKCLGCGLVWQTRKEAMICADSLEHSPIHLRFYAGNHKVEIHSVRRED